MLRNLAWDLPDRKLGGGILESLRQSTDVPRPWDLRTLGLRGVSVRLSRVWAAPYQTKPL